jgi:hypothetical protein
VAELSIWGRRLTVAIDLLRMELIRNDLRVVDMAAMRR